MTENPQRIPRIIWVGYLLVSLTMATGFLVWWLQTSRSLQSLRVIGPVADFTLTNQDDKISTLADFTNHVWVADIIFTRCAGPCPAMTGRMKSLQTALPPTSAAKLVTLTTDPDNDTHAVMKRYGERFGADSNRWIFLTGTKKEIAALGSGSLKLSSVPVKLDEQKDPVDLFIHGTYFVVVDKHAQLRGIFETGGEGVEWTNVQPRIIEAVRQLEHEP